MDSFVLQGKNIDKILGKDAVAVITDEVLVGLIPTRINGVDNCIALKIHGSQDCGGVHQFLTKRAQMLLVQELEEDGCDFTYITMPMCHRSRRRGWETAAEMFALLAKVAREQAKKEPYDD
jgi:hypothetical protein